MTPFQEGRVAHDQGMSRSDNPYNKGVPGLRSEEINRLALMWNSGYTAGQWSKVFQDASECCGN